MELSILDLYEIDPYKAVDAVGKWFMSFNSERSIIEARKLMEDYLNQFPKNKRWEVLQKLKRYNETSKKVV